MDKLSPAARLELIMSLLGGATIYDEDGEPTGTVTPPMITIEEAKRLLNMEDQEDG